MTSRHHSHHLFPQSITTGYKSWYQCGEHRGVTVKGTSPRPGDSLPRYQRVTLWSRQALSQLHVPVYTFFLREHGRKGQPPPCNGLRFWPPGTTLVSRQAPVSQRERRGTLPGCGGGKKHGLRMRSDTPRSVQYPEMSVRLGCLFKSLCRFRAFS